LPPPFAPKPDKEVKWKPLATIEDEPDAPRRHRPRRLPRVEAKRSLSHVLTDLLDVNDMTDPEMEAVWTLLRYQKRKEAAEAAASNPQE
jgi:hypothetical protein